MTSATFTDARARPWPVWLQVPAPVLAAALVVFAAILLRPGVLDDGDTYWHLAAGRWMLAHGRPLTHDVFSFTAPNAPWVAHEWLSECLMAGAYALGGWSGLLLLFAAAGGLAAGLLAQSVSRHLNPLSTAALLALSLNLAARELLTRPHLLALPLLVLCGRELLRARAQERRPALWLPAVIALWANLHGSYVFGGLLMAGFGLEALLAAPTARRLTVAREWGLIGVLSLAAALATPHGAQGLVYPFKIMSMQTLQAIDEWKPPSMVAGSPLAIALLATLAVGLSRGVRVLPVRLGLLLVVLGMALQHQRHLLVLAVIGPLLLAEPLGAALGALRPRTARPWLLPAFAAAVAVLIGLRFAQPAQRIDGENAPVTALAHLPPQLAGRPVLNSYGFGGWLIFKGHPVFIDGRADMYGDAFVRRYLSIWRGDPAALDWSLAQYGIDWTLLEPGDRLVKVMDARAGWRRMYADRFAVIHVREGAL
jgi:hypothetical protein